MSATFGRHARDEHKRVARMLGYCLALRDEHAMLSLAVVLRGRLTPAERAFLAVASLEALDPDDYDAVSQFMEARKDG